MAIAHYSKFDQYKNLLFSLTEINAETVKNEQFLLDKDEKKNIKIYYAPFEHVNEKAKIVIVGITPGLHQMGVSFSTVMNANRQWTDEEILHEVKKNSSFEGPMRKNLIMMLDELKLQNYLGLSSTSELFDTASHLVHTTSVITYPVFRNGKNFNGSTPNILKTEVLKKYVLEQFAMELRDLDQPFIIPLGVNVSKVLQYLAENGYIDPNSILSGFPHPSGGNGHRHKQFAQNKEDMQRQIERYFASHKI